jgi:hypothetical protein
VQKGQFADLIVAGLTTDVSLLDSIVGLAWSKEGSDLLIRVQPVNPDAWREIGELLIDNLRQLVDKVRFRARIQQLNVDGVMNLIFAIRPLDQAPVQSPQHHQQHLIH